MKVEDIAMIVHEVNKAYCETLGDYTQLPWDHVPEDMRETVLNGVHFVLDNPDAGPAELHDNWVAEKIADGWMYGEVKSREHKTHPCLVPYEELPIEQRVKNQLFRGVVMAASQV